MTGASKEVRATRKLSLDDLRVVESVHRLGSVDAAAREHGVAPSTIYRRIAALEKASGGVCLSRGGGLTPFALELAKVALSADADVNRALGRLRAAEETVGGRVKLTSIEAFAPLLTAPLAELRRAHPGLTIEVDLSDRGSSLKRHEADLAISIIPRPPAHLVGRALFTIRYGVYGLPELADRGDDAPWIVLAAPAHTTPEAQWERAHVPPARVALATASRRLFIDLVVAGTGVGLLPRPLARRHPELVEVASWRPSLTELRRPAWLLTHPDLKGQARISVTMSALAAALKSEG